MRIHHKAILSFIFVLAILALVAVFSMGEKKLANSDANNGSIQFTENGEVAGANSAQDSYLAKLAKDLSEKGAVLYCSASSEDCKAQLALFNAHSDLLDYVECDPASANANVDECHAQKIETYPTWIFEETRRTGTQELSSLAAMVGFGQ